MKQVLARWLGRRPRGVLDPDTLPPAAEYWLRPGNGTLQTLEAHYAAMDAAVTTPLAWDDARLSAEDLLYFRADTHFLWQRRGPNQTPHAYRLTARHLVAAGLGPLLDQLGEDGAFGAFVLDVDGRPVSRDLLDSAGEIDFLRRHAGLGRQPLDIIDIGAGYGRLAWRIEQAIGDGTRIFATDAYAKATFVADFYLHHRKARQAKVAPLHAVEALLAGTRIGLAVNVHSFSECRPEAIAWWAERLAAAGVPKLMIVPNDGGSSGAGCETNERIPMAPILARFGYRPVVSEPRYADPHVQRHGVDSTWLHLFERA